MGALGLQWVLPGRWGIFLEYGGGFILLNRALLAQSYPDPKGFYQLPIILGAGCVKSALGL